MPTHKSNLVRNILFAGMTVALLDGFDAIIYFTHKYGITIARLFQSMASAVLGRRSFSLGWKSVVLGILIQFFVAFTVTLIYAALNRRIPFLSRYFWLSGVVYGIGVYLIMEFVVLPLTAQVHAHHAGLPPDLANGLFAHIFLVGLPIAWILRRDGPVHSGQATW